MVNWGDEYGPAPSNLFLLFKDLDIVELKV